MMVYGNIVGPNATIGDFYPGYAMWQSGAYPPYGDPSLYWGDSWNYWQPMMLTAKKNIQAKKARVQEKLAGVEFLEENDNKKVELKNELADVEAELAEVDAKYTELIAKSKDSESEVIDMSTGAKDAVNEADVKANADESSSPLGLSAEEGEGELDANPGFEFDAQEPMLDSVGSQETDQMVAMPSAQMQSGVARSEADTGMNQGLTGSMTSDMLQATNQGMAAASLAAASSQLASTIEGSHMSGDHPIIPDKFLGEALKIGYDPERDQAWRTWMPADILAKVDAQVQKAKAAANSAN
jgi:hypothetical protein